MEIITTLSAYQAVALQSAIYPDQGKCGGLTYTVLKLNSEAGEVAKKVCGLIRDKGANVSTEDHEALLNELGDVLWYITATAKELGSSLATVANMNLQRLNIASVVKEYVTRSNASAERQQKIEGLWQDILDKDDRTSPAEYPDMALITFDEFTAAINTITRAREF